MALPTQSYVWLRVKHVVGLWVLRETGLASTQFIWSEQNEARPALPYIGGRRRNFPLDNGDDGESLREVVLASTLTVTASAVGETAAMLLFGLRYAYTLQVGDDTETARDALLAAIEVDRLRTIAQADGINKAVGFQPCTIAANGVDGIDFAGLGAAPVRVTSVEGCTATPTDEDLRSVQTGLRRAVVRLELFWPEQMEGFETIDEYAETLRSSLLTTETALWLQARGVGVEQGKRINTQDASAVSGGGRERRQFFDVLFNANSKTYREGVALAGAKPPTVEILA